MKKFLALIIASVCTIVFSNVAFSYEKPKKDGAEKIAVDNKPETPSSFSGSHYSKGDFSIGLTPGMAVGQSNPDVSMDIGVVGNYFFRDNLSLGLRVDTFTDFKDSAISFMPKIGFYYDHNEDWTLYANAGFGFLYAIDAKESYANMGIPGIGVSYHVNDNLSLSLDSNINILIKKDFSLVLWSIGPMVSYRF